jgi:ribosomal protein S18 acetylase RimI-like enzyme
LAIMCTCRLVLSQKRHAQVNNQEAIDFYQKFGFAVGEVMKDYYKKIEPPDAVVLSKKLK